MMTDRQMKLASYHARKVAERQHQQQLQLQERGGSTSSQYHRHQEADTSSTKSIMAGSNEINIKSVEESSSLSSSTIKFHAAATTVQPAITSSNHTSNSKNADNEGMNRDAMKQLFASRRRRALAEMQSHTTTTTTANKSTDNTTTITTTTTTIVGTTPAAVAAATQSSSSNNYPNSLDSCSNATSASNSLRVVAAVLDSNEKREGGGGTIQGNNNHHIISNHNSNQRRMSGDECSSSSISTTVSITASSSMMITSSSRRALDRYLGKGLGNNDKTKRVEGSKSNGESGSGGGGGSIASKSSSTTTTSHHRQDTMESQDNAVIAKTKVNGDEREGNTTLVPHRATTTTAAAATTATMMKNTVVVRGTKHEISSNTTNAVTKDATKSVRFQLSPSRLRSDEKNYYDDVVGVDSITNYSQLNKEERPYDDEEEEGMEPRPYDEKEEWTNRSRELDDGKTKRNEHETRKIKTQCSPPRSSTTGIGDGVERRNVKSSNDNDRVWVDTTTTDDSTEFAMFVEGLRREVAGDHTELWAGFQALLGRSRGEQVPLCVSSHDGGGGGGGGGDNNGKKDAMKKKKIKMDPRTQNCLTAIHRHLMEDSRVKSNFMTTSSQLVNDKKVRKGRVKIVRSEGDGVLDDKGRVDSIEATYSVSAAKTCAGNQRHDCEVAADNDTMTTSVPDVHSTREYVYSNGRPQTLQQQQQQQQKHQRGQYQHQDKRESWLRAYKDKKSAHLSSKSKLKITSAPSPKSNNFGPIKLTRTNNIVASRSDGIEELGTEGGLVLNDSKRRLSWMEALKAKQKSLRSKQSADSDDSGGSIRPSSQEDAPVSPLSTLRMISPRKKSRHSPSTPKGAPWLNVQLRSTPKTRSSMVTDAGPSDNPNSNANPSSLAENFALAPACLTSHYQPSESSTLLTLPALCCIGDIIDLDALPSKVFPTHEGEAAIFPLKQSVKDPSKGGGDVEKVVIVGRTAIATADIITPSTVDATRKASVTWWCRRSEIRTLTLNVEATGANLAHVYGRTPLLFDSADVCLNFAQSFYRGPTTKCDDALGTVSKSNATGSGTLINGDERVVNGGVTNLTNDEECLLDRYRQYSQSDRTKLQLTCLSPQGELQEMEVNLGPSSELSQSRKFVRQYSLTNPTLEAATTSSMHNTERKPSLSMEEEETASKYRKMLKMGIPPDAVRHKMTSDEIQPMIMAAVLLDDSTSMTSTGESAKKEESTKGNELLTNEEEVIADKYRKMLKMGVPLDGVKHKMAQDSVDLKIISVLVREVVPSSAATEVESDNSTSNKNMSSKIDGPLLSGEEEAVANTYRNMLKVCIPKEAVRHKMKQDGIISKIVEAVLGKDASEVIVSDSASSQPKTTNRKTIAFHWTTSNLAPELLEQSIFGRTELKKRQLALVNPEESDIKKLEEIFQKRSSSNTIKIKTGGHNDDGNNLAKLLDLTRANNIAISLKSFNDFSFHSLAETIGDLDPNCTISGERVQFLPNLLPTPKEIQAIKGYKGDDEKLITAELFFRQLVSIKRIEDKVKVMQAMSSFEEHVEEVRAGLKTLQEVCSQVMNSEKLIQVLEMVLNIGNLMNAGTLHGGVEAFKFESLPKLSETKSADGKTTVLDYIVETFIEKGERQALFLLSEFPTIQDSSRLSIGDLMNDIISLRNDFKLCTNELSKMKHDQRLKVLPMKSTKVANGSEADDPRKALFSAILSRGSKEDDKVKQPPDPRKALFAAITKRKADNNEESDDDTADPGVEYTPGVHRLQKFLIHSDSILSIANDDLDSAIRACKGLAVYCGEDGGERAAASLLQVLSSFALSLESGVKKYDQRVEAEKKRAVRKHNDKGKENDHNINSVSTTRLLKSSSFQPHVGHLNKGSHKCNPLNAILNAIKDRGAQLSDDSSGIALRVTTSSNDDSRQALLASIKNRRDSVPNKPPPDGVPDRIQHINSNIARKESRVLLVNRMLAKAPPSVKQDFLRGVTYKETDDPLLRRIYDKESNTDGEEEEANVVKNWKAMDPRQELFSAIKGRRSDD